jgi:hypothetical protein
MSSLLLAWIGSPAPPAISSHPCGYDRQAGRLPFTERHLGGYDDAARSLDADRARRLGGDDPKVLIQAIRRHWTIENGLHWVLDVTFREDDSRVRDRTAARNLAILRKVAINLISHGRTAQISMRARRKQAAWNDAYMLSLLAG